MKLRTLLEPQFKTGQKVKVIDKEKLMKMYKEDRFLYDLTGEMVDMGGEILTIECVAIEDEDFVTYFVEENYYVWNECVLVAAEDDETEDEKQTQEFGFMYKPGDVLLFDRGVYGVVAKVEDNHGEEMVMIVTGSSTDGWSLEASWKDFEGSEIIGKIKPKNDEEKFLSGWYYCVDELKETTTIVSDEHEIREHFIIVEESQEHETAVLETKQIDPSQIDMLDAIYGVRQISDLLGQINEKISKLEAAGFNPQIGVNANTDVFQVEIEKGGEKYTLKYKFKK